MQPILSSSTPTVSSPQAPLSSTSREDSLSSPPKPVFLDPQLQSLFSENKIDYDGKLRLENMTLPSHTPIEPDAIEFVGHFMTTPFQVQGVLTESTRSKIREAFRNRPCSEILLNRDFMKTTETFAFSFYLTPAALFHTLLDLCQGQFIKLIGGKSRQALKNTFIQMVETITEKPCALSSKKLEDFTKPCPDWDFVIPVQGATFEQLKTLQEIVINTVTVQLFGQHRAEIQILYQYLVREVLFKTSEAFQDDYYTAISIGNASQKIDIVFLPTVKHNSIFEYNKIGITIHKDALNCWRNDQPLSACVLPPLALDVFNCGEDRGYQAGFDFIYDIIRSTNYRHVNKKGFARLLLWICKGKICFHRDILTEFHHKLNKTGKLSEEIGRQLQYCYESHCMGNVHALLALYLNTFIALDLIHQQKTDIHMEDIRLFLKPIFGSASDEKQTNTFGILLPLIHQASFNTRFFVDFLTVCAFLGKCSRRAFFDQTALQLTDEFSLLLPIDTSSPFENILHSYHEADAAVLKQLFDHLVSSKSAHPSSIEHFSPEQKTRLKELALNFLEHSDKTLQRIGLRLTMLFLKGEPKLFERIFACFPYVIFEESSEFSLRVLAYMERCSEGISKDNIYAQPIKELTAILKKSSGQSAICLAWMYSLIKTKQHGLLKIGMTIWNRLSHPEKNREAPHLFDTIAPAFPEEALELYLQNDHLIRVEFLSKLIVKFRHSPAKFVSYGLKLLAALDKTLPFLDVSHGRKKRSPYAQEFFWLYCQSIQLVPERAVPLLKHLHAIGCLDLHQEEAAHHLCGLSDHLSSSVFIEVWNLAVSFGCPLLEIKSPKKNTCLIQLCEDLHRAKHPHTSFMVTHTAAQELEPEQIRRLQMLIMKMPSNDALRVYLSKDQILELNFTTIAMDLQNRRLMEAAKMMQAIWDDLSDDQRERILESELIITKQLLQDYEQPGENDQAKQLTHVRSFLERKTRFITTVNPAAVTKDLAEAWGRFFITVLERLIAQPASAKSAYNSVVEPLVSLLMRNQSYPIACKVLEIAGYNKMEIGMTTPIFRLLSELVDNYEIQKVESVLTLLKWYQNAHAFPREQVDLYVNLVNRLFLANGTRTDVWIQRILALSSTEHPIEGQVVATWVNHLFRLGNTACFPEIYSHMEAITFSHADEANALYQRWVREAGCPYFCARLIANHLPAISQQMHNAEVQILLLRVLQMWIQQPSPSATDDLLFCLKLYTQNIPHIWCRAIEIFSNSELPARSDCWLLFELICVRGTFDQQPRLKAITCLNALKALIGSEGRLFLNLLQNLDGFQRYIATGTDAEKEEALFLIFRENLRHIQLLGDPIEDVLLAMQLLQIRSCARHIEPMGRVDRQIIADLGKMGHQQIFPFLLSYIKREFGQHSTLLNEAVQLLVQSISGDLLTSWHAVCVFLIDYVDVVNLNSLLKKALSSNSKGVHLAIGYLIKELMKRDPVDPHEKVLVSCLVSKIAEILTEQNTITLGILNHPHVKNWLSEACILKCWELIVIDKLNYGAQAATPLSSSSLDLFREKFPMLKQLKSMKACMQAGNDILARLLNEKGDLKEFQKEMASFHKTLLQYQGESTKAVPREPIDLTRPSGKRKMVCHSREQMMRALQNLQNVGSASIEVKRKGDIPTYSFPSAESFYEFMVERVKGKDEIHSPDFVMRGQGVQDLPSKLRQKIVEEYAVEAVDVAAPEEVRTLLEFETLEYLFQDKAGRDLYVSAIVDLNRALCGIKTSNLDVRQFVILLCARHLLFLIEHYPEYKDPIFTAVHAFVFASAAVDFQHGAYRTERGKEKCDQDVFNYHNDWCHEILTTLQVKFSNDVNTYPPAFYEAMLVVYPLEIYPQELTPQLQASIIFSTISRLLQSHSSVHYSRALEILRIHQNMILNANEALAFAYQQMAHAVLRDPNYLVHEKNLVFFGPEGERKECLYIAKKPLFYLLNEALRDNVNIFGKPGTQQKTILTHFSEVSRIISVVHFNVMFELLENPVHANPHFDVLYIVISGLNDIAKRGCFAENHVAYRDFVMRAKPLLLARLRKESNKKETLQFMNLPYLFLIPFPTQNRSQKEHWLTLFNQMIKELLEIDDASFREYVKSLVKDHFIESGFFNTCKTKLQEIKKIIA